MTSSIVAPASLPCLAILPALCLFADAPVPPMDFFDKLAAYGPLGIFMAVVLTLVVWYGPQVARAHIKYLEVTADTISSNSQSQAKIATSTERLTELNVEQTKANIEQSKTLTTISEDKPNLTMHQRTQRCLILLAEARALESSNPQAKAKIDLAIAAVRDNP